MKNIKYNCLFNFFNFTLYSAHNRVARVPSGLTQWDLHSIYIETLAFLTFCRILKVFPRYQSDKMKILNNSFLRLGTESTTCPVYSGLCSRSRLATTQAMQVSLIDKAIQKKGFYSTWTLLKHSPTNRAKSRTESQPEIYT